MEFINSALSATFFFEHLFNLYKNLLYKTLYVKQIHFNNLF